MLQPLIRVRRCHVLTASSPRLGRTRTFHVSSSAHKQSEPILLDEFRKHFEHCIPAQEKGKGIAVAFSGGPDSTCLLYLLKQLTRRDANNGLRLNNIVAVTVDHGLQAASSQMTAKCVTIANSLQVKHRVLKIPWGAAPFPVLPPKDSSFENLAREARYHLLLSTLKEEAISMIAFGHHADDQVETALLRISRGSTEVGVAGMQARRLWGMGFGLGPEDLGWAGQHGMSRWIVRPLLRLPKGRLIATCQEAGLDYVVDKTNFLPNVTLRNRLRYQLGHASSSSLTEGTKALLDMAAKVTVCGGGTQRTPDVLQEDSLTSFARLRTAVESISDFVEKLNHEASIQLAKCLRTSPVSTILLSKDAFSRVTDNAVRFEIIRRILRFVSPFPWGSPRAEAGRRSASLQLISDILTMSREYSRSRKDGQAALPPKSFVAGGGVIWSPVCITQNAEMKFSEKGCSITDEMGWLVSRQPPIQRFGNSAAKSLELDITAMALSALSQNCSAEILYDCRFILLITPRLFPPEVLNLLKQLTAESAEVSVDQASVKLLVIPHTRYFLPRIVLRRTDAQAELPSSDGYYRPQGQENSREDEHEIARLLPDGSTRTQSSIGENNKDGNCPACSGEAVRIKCIRILDADTMDAHLDQQSM